MTGSAITIIIGQWNKLFGISNVALHNPPYRILIDIISKLPTTRVDVAFGLTALVFLYAIKFLCNRISCRSKKLQNSIFLFGIMRNGLIVIVGTFISFLINRHRDKSLISIIESVPAGFDAMGVPKLHLSIIKEAGGLVPSICLILILEHISVAKSFGRMYGYTVNSDQEILAIGVSNAVGSFFG
jgi:sodium-independent sulfate anion transporter 11